MTLAHRLAQQGQRVTLFESAPSFGGLTSAWKIGNVTQLQDVYAQVDDLERSEIMTATVFHAEISPLYRYLAGIALALLLAERILLATWLRVAEEVD